VRRGFVMLTTLWIMSVASVVAMAAALAGRHDVSEGIARAELERAWWVATGCEHRAQAAVDSVLEVATSIDDGAARWRILQRLVSNGLPAGKCDVSLEAAGTRLDLNSASKDMIVNLLSAVGLGAEAPAMADALIDWRDPDDEPLPLGAESTWYRSAGRVLPRNAPLADVGELRRIKGFESITGLDSVVSIEPARVSLATAPVSVLMAVSGITRETAGVIVEREETGNPISDLISVAGLVSASSADTLAAHFPDAVRSTTPDPDAWLMVVRARAGKPAVSVVLQWRIIRTGRRCEVVSTRSRL
jgi:general secretion pathway protein K